MRDTGGAVAGGLDSSKRSPRNLVAKLLLCAAAVTFVAPLQAAPAVTATVTATDLGTLGGEDSVATKINDAGQVIGFSHTAGNVEYHGFLWTATGGMVDMGTLGGTYSSPVAINDQ